MSSSCKKLLSQMTFNQPLINILQNLVPFTTVPQKLHMLTKNFHAYSVLDVQTDNEGRKLVINIEIPNTKQIFTLISVYAPNVTAHRINFFNELEHWITHFSKTPQHLIIGDDFNCSDKTDNQSKQLDRSYETFTKLKILKDLNDAFNSCNPLKQDYTYVHPSDKSRNSTIDYILVSSAVLEFIK